MGVASKLSITIVYCFALIVLLTFGQFLVLKNLQHPETVDLTCISKDENAALVWNYDPEDHLSFRKIPVFSPMTPSPNDVTSCAVWNNPSLCSVQWREKNSWEVVSTTLRPMAPVFDHRWEGFKEYVLNTTAYQYVGVVPESAGSVVFSARGSSDVDVFLCRHEKFQDASCMWISLSGSKGISSTTIKSCGKGRPELDEPKDCEPIGESTKNGTEAEINLYEWRTYIVKWAEKTISIYKADEIEPFLTGKMSQTFDKVHVSVKSDVDSRIRFHFYDYFMTEKDNAVISTDELANIGSSFCVELLLGLCSSCKLNVSLMDWQDHLETWTIPSSEDATYNELLTWRSFRLEKNLTTSEVRFLQVTVKTVLDDDEDRGQWAIGNFRTCTRLDEIRKSTVKIRSLSDGHEQPIIKCQRLSYNKPGLVDTKQGAEKRDSDKLELYMRENKEELRRYVRLFGKHYSVCDDKGCLCARGFSGDDCGTKCTDGHYGYNCADECTNCSTTNQRQPPCNGTTGYCTDRCTNPKLFPPDCKEEIRDPIVTEITDTTVKINQIMKIEDVVNVNVSFILTEVKLNRSSYLPEPIKTANGYELELEDLKSNTYYEVHTQVEIMGKYPRWVISSSKTFFATTCNGKALFELLPGEHILTINKLIRDKICADPDDDAEEDYAFEVKGIPGETKKNTTFPFTFLNLTSYSEYRVDVKKNDATGPVIFSTRVRTIESVPSEPRDLTTTPRSRGFVKLRWQPPSRSQADIQKFVIIVNLVDTRLLNPTKEKTWKFNHMVSEKLYKYSRKLSLPPSSNYVIFILAVTVNNVTSKNATANFTNPPSVGFDRKQEHELTQSGTIIKTEYPTIVNATCQYLSQREENRPEGILWMGANQSTSRNCSLYIGIKYTITATVEDWGVVKNTTLGTITLTCMNLWLLVWLSLVLIISAICLILLKLKCKKVATKPREPSYLEILPPQSSDDSTDPCAQNYSNPQPDAVDHVYSMPNDPNSRSVSSEYFEEYAKKAADTGLLMMQFMSLPRGLTRPCVYGSLPVNESKNRYQNLMAYDETRVVLEKIPGDCHSDYINASFIEGYLNERAYIATQGPKPNTVNDFWRMIWQQDVRVICMLTNIVEGSTTLSERYWPEPGTRSKYGDIEIANADHQAFADYTFRTFKLSFQHDTRKVTHLHYTGWPTIGVPMSPQSLVAYLKKLKETPTGNGPVVVHCHTGDERTGTIILSDICLRQAAAEGVIDVPAVTRRMRSGRANMVGTPQHYLLAHILITESMMSHPTQIPCENLPQRIKKMRLRLPDDIQRLNDTMWQQQALQSFATPDSAAAKEPVTEKLFPTFESNSSSVNAVSVDGVRMQKRYLASRLPSPFKLSRFWEFIIDKDIKLVIILQCSDPKDPTCCDIMPDESIFDPVPHIRVESELNLDGEEHFKTENLLLTDTSEGIAISKSLTVLTCKGWEPGKNGKPPKAGTLVSLWRASEKIPRKEGQTLVLCQDGITGCGLYLALSYLLERMAVERECDVFAAVRAVRRSRPEFVKASEQFYYLYDAAVAYSDYFQCYANFG